LKKSIFSKLRLAMSSLWWKMCFTKLIQIHWFIFRHSEELFCSVSPDWNVWVVKHDACTCASFWSSITYNVLLFTYPSFHEVCKNNSYNRYCQYFLFLCTTSSNVNVYHKIYNESFTMKLYKKYPFTPSKLKNKYISTLKYCEYMCPGFAWSECINYICTSLNVMLSCMF
jgi:hypothetical protein